MPRNHRARPRRIAALALLAAGSCGGDAPARLPGRDLLARPAHELREQPGTLAPADARWPDFAFDGWRVERTAQRSVAWAVVREARLRLPLLAPIEREIELALVPPPGLAPGARLALKLNDQALGEIELGEGTALHTLPAPAAAWRAGDNVLSCKGAAYGRDEHGDVFFGLERVRYAARELRVERTERGYVLPSDGGLAYRLETVADGELHVRGASTGAGVLELVVRGVDPWSGTPRAEPLATRAFRAADGEVEGSCALARARETLQLELRWIGAEPGSVCAVAGLSYADAAPAPRRSVLFVSIDTFSAQHTSLHGYARETTPELAAFARDAILFRNCRANAPWTIPSYMSQFTGLLPSAHMLMRDPELERLPDPWELHQIAPNRWTLAEFFRAAGYRTAAFVDNPWLAHGFGFPSGFDEYDTQAADVPLSDPEGGLRSIVPRVLAWLDRREREEPFFLFVQAFDPHAPYAPVAPWKGRFGADDLVDPEWRVPVGREQSFAYGCIPQHIASALHPAGGPEALAVAPIVAAYDEKVLEVDAAMAGLLAGLKERGVYDEILIVFSADHGESTTGHDLFFNHSLLYNDVLHVPLIVRLPGGEASGRVVEPVVQLVDLYPTLLEFVLGDAERGLHGRSLLALMRGDEDASARDVGYAEWGMMEQASLESGGWKLIATQPLAARLQTQLTSPRLDRKRLGEVCPELATGYFTDAEIAEVLKRNPAAQELLRKSLEGIHFELYRVAEDPLEVRDVAKDHPEVVERLLATMAMGREMGATAQGMASFLAPAKGLSEDDMAELKALGYGGDH